MNIVWSSVAITLIALAAGAAVAGGEPAMAELRLAEAPRAAGVADFSAVCLLESDPSARAAAPID
mgnify:CR=1 FL=1